MASASLIPKNGAIVLGSYACDFASFDIDGGQAADDVTPYGANIAAKHVGSGTASFSMNVGAFALAHATGTPPALASASGAFIATGVAATFTLDTGVSEAAQVIITRWRISHARMRGYVPFGISMVNAADLTETWATT